MRQRLLGGVVLAALTLACGGDGNGGSPTNPTPQVAQVGGVWTYTSTLTGVSGGECVGAIFASSIGFTDSGTMQVTQTGSALTAVATSNSDGSSCRYSGTAGATTIALNWTSCDVGVLTGIGCPNGSIRDARLVTSGITANVVGTNASGTTAESWNILSSSTQAGVGVMTLNGTFSAQRR